MSPSVWREKISASSPASALIWGERNQPVHQPWGKESCTAEKADDEKYGKTTQKSQCPNKASHTNSGLPSARKSYVYTTL